MNSIQLCYVKSLDCDGQKMYEYYTFPVNDHNTLVVGQKFERVPRKLIGSVTALLPPGGALSFFNGDEEYVDFFVMDEIIL